MHYSQYLLWYYISIFCSKQIKITYVKQSKQITMRILIVFIFVSEDLLLSCSMSFDEKMLVFLKAYWYLLICGVSLIWYQPVHFQFYSIFRAVFLSISIVLSIDHQIVLVIYQFFFGFIKHGLNCSVKEIFWHKLWRWGSNGGLFNRDSDVLSGSWSCVSGGIYNEYFLLGLWIDLKLT